MYITDHLLNRSFKASHQCVLPTGAIPEPHSVVCANSE